MNEPKTSEIKTSDRLAAIADVAKDIKENHVGRDWHGEIFCPMCAGRLVVMHSGQNGHTHGRCDTKDCLQWMD